ncbi:hypothetical protein BDV98DRAFT_568669 [Pterulicium gracile]|uniref:FHA domain-containing protein n=1 Tax=Pterulicium gracile TaxID=1884261 RepID=A0A5C3QFA3_9AGAR|nr:hypothetical protein BDV98DRAFT_568669 [Pterula gracilis]
MAYFLTSSLILQLSATPDSYPFSSRFIPIQKNMSPVVLGTGGTSSSSGRQTPASPTRSCSPHISAPPDARNGWFTPAERDQSGPIPVGAQHAEILVKDGEVCIRDLESGFGTYVNGARLQSNGQPTPLRKGDVIVSVP